MIKPDVLLMDEPLSNLDAKLRLEMRQAIRSLQREVGITSDGLPEALQGLGQPHIVATGPEIPPLQVKIMCFQIGGEMLDESLRLADQQFDLQVLDDGAGDLLLQGKNVLQISLEFLRPERKTVGDTG